MCRNAAYAPHPGSSWPALSSAGSSSLVMARMCLLLHHIFATRNWCICGIAKHLRAILGQPVHLSRTTNAEVYEQAGILHPISYLLQRCLVYQTQHAQSQDPMMTSTVHVEWLDGVNASLTSLQPTSHSHSADVCHKGIETRPQEGAAPGDLLVTSRGDLPARFMCPECLLCFATLSDLKGHWRRHHDTPFPKRTDVSRGAYGLNGLPTCRFCKQHLSSWAYLEKHISEQRCEALWLHEQNGTDGFDPPVQESTGPPPSPSGATQLSPQFLSLAGPVLNSSAFQGLMQEQGWRRLLQVQDLCLHLRQHCIQCNQWVVDGAHLKHHIRCHHKSTWARHHSEATKSCPLLVKCAASPCSWCGRRPGKPARHVTQCAVALATKLLCTPVRSWRRCPWPKKLSCLGRALRTCSSKPPNAPARKSKSTNRTSDFERTSPASRRCKDGARHGPKARANPPEPAHKWTT